MKYLIVFLSALFSCIAFAESLPPEKSFLLKLIQKNVGFETIDCHKGLMEEWGSQYREFQLELCLSLTLESVSLTEFAKAKVLKRQVFTKDTIKSLDLNNKLKEDPIKKFSLLNALSEIFRALKNQQFLAEALIWNTFDWKSSLLNKKIELELLPKTKLMNLNFLKLSFDEKFNHLQTFEAKLVDSNTRYIFRVNSFKRWKLVEAPRFFNLQPK